MKFMRPKWTITTTVANTHIRLSTYWAVTFTYKSESFDKETIYFLIAYFMDPLSNLYVISLKDLIDTYLMFGTGDVHTLKMLFTHLSTYLSPRWLKLISFKE